MGGDAAAHRRSQLIGGTLRIDNLNEHLDQLRQLIRVKLLDSANIIKARTELLLDLWVLPLLARCAFGRALPYIWECAGIGRVRAGLQRGIWGVVDLLLGLSVALLFQKHDVCHFPAVAARKLPQDVFGLRFCVLHRLADHRLLDAIQHCLVDIVV